MLLCLYETCFADMYLRQQPKTTMPQHSIFNQPYNPGAQNAPMVSQTPKMPVSHTWVNPNPVLSMESVTVNPSATLSNVIRPASSRQLQPNRGPEAGFPHRMEHNNFESNVLPQLSMRDLQYLDPGSQGADVGQHQSQPLFHMQSQREVLAPEAHLDNSNQGPQTVWPNFNPLHPGQSSFHGSVSEDGGGSQVLGSLSFLEGMEGDDFFKDLMQSPTGFQLKQEPQTTVGQECHASVMQVPVESQENTYTNLLPCPIGNGTHMDTRQDVSQPLSNLQNPYSRSSAASDAHFVSLDDWIKATRHKN